MLTQLVIKVAQICVALLDAQKCTKRIQNPFLTMFYTTCQQLSIAPYQAKLYANSWFEESPLVSSALN